MCEIENITYIIYKKEKPVTHSGNVILGSTKFVLIDVQLFFPHG